ncbi:hypothetical protein F5146DRAFT_625431 [Armillaria mellea]|nr:hypothetical protein F5146DRAFT_625431 [Armillaria mellea]
MAGPGKAGFDLIHAGATFEVTFLHLVLALSNTATWSTAPPFLRLHSPPPDNHHSASELSARLSPGKSISHVDV